MLPESGVPGLSLRQLAIQAGVSHNAPYMHFSNRDALLAAIAGEGFVQLRAALLQNEQGDWRDRLIAGCQTYVEFGTGHPELFQVMFMEHDEAQYAEYLDDSLAALQTLTDIIAEGQSLKQIKSGDAHEFATLIWSMLHGVAVLFTRRTHAPLPYRSDDPADITAKFLGELIEGLDHQP